MTQTDQATAQIRAHALRGPWHAFLVDSEDTVIDDPASVTHTAGRFATTVVRGSALPIGASGFGYVLPRGFDVGDVAYIRGCVGLRVALVDYERAKAMAAGLNAASGALAAPADAQATPTPVNVTDEPAAYCPSCSAAVPLDEITDEHRHTECGAFVQPA